MRSSCSRAGLAVDAAASGAKGAGREGSPRRARGRARTNGADRFRLVCKFPALSTASGKLRRNGGPCVRQNRVVLAVVATVKLLRMRFSRQPARVPVNSARRGRPEGTRLPGERGISRPTIAQGRLSDRHHLYAAVRFFCVCLLRSRPWVRCQHPAFPVPSCSRGRSDQAKLGRFKPRGRAGVSHLQSDDARWAVRTVILKCAPSGAIALLGKSRRMCGRAASGLIILRGSARGAFASQASRLRMTGPIWCRGRSAAPPILRGASEREKSRAGATRLIPR